MLGHKEEHVRAEQSFTKLRNEMRTELAIFAWVPRHLITQHYKGAQKCPCKPVKAPLWHRSRKFCKGLRRLQSLFNSPSFMMIHHSSEMAAIKKSFVQSLESERIPESPCRALAHIWPHFSPFLFVITEISFQLSKETITRGGTLPKGVHFRSQNGSPNCQFVSLHQNEAAFQSSQLENRH